MSIKVDYAVLESSNQQMQAISRTIDEKLDTLRAMLLGASNSWFPVSLSAISVPSGGSSELGRLVEEHWAVLKDAGEPAITVLPAGSVPSTQQVTGANLARIGATVDRRSGQVTVLCAIDNLVKGTAGAALQSMNLALGLPEHAGLSRTALAP